AGSNFIGGTAVHVHNHHVQYLGFTGRPDHAARRLVCGAIDLRVALLEELVADAGSRAVEHYGAMVQEHDPWAHAFDLPYVVTYEQHGLAAPPYQVLHPIEALA